MADRRTGMRWPLPAATALLAVSGCGMTVGDESAGPAEEPSPSVIVPALPSTMPRPSGTTRRGPQPVEVQYHLHIDNAADDSPLDARYNITTDGGTKVRLKISLYGEPGIVTEESVYTWDGGKILAFSEQNEPPYRVYEAPDEHPDESQLVTHWPQILWSAPKGAQCIELKSTKTIIGRAAVGYRCVTATPQPGEPATGQLWRDQATGILLTDETMVAEKLVLAPTIDATTFSTKPPAGARSIVIAAKTPSPGQTKRAPDFTLDLIKGGRIGLKDLAGKPFVLAFYMSDLAFDESGEVCPGCREALLALQTQTGNGVKPRVVGVQVGDLGKPGYPLAVPGVTLTLAHEQTPMVQNSFGLTGMVSFVFIRADGAIAAAYDHAPTNQQITQSLAALH